MRALACLLALTLAMFLADSHSAAKAQDRGYGGPETVGPNFSTGKQSEPPDYGTGQPKKQNKAVTPQSPAKKVAKPEPAKKPSNPKSIAKQSDPPETSPKEEAETKTEAVPAATSGTAAKSSTPDTPETSSSQTNAASSGTTPATKPETCRRFDATTGTTLEVACN